jgi:hypothetical protein
LPLAAQQVIASAIAEDSAAYAAASGASGVSLANPANGFTALVQSGNLQVAAGADTWDMSLIGLGYGTAAQPLGTAQTSVNGNRVDSNYGNIDEWFVNGPTGLEQGFNVAPLPQSELTGSLTLELAMSGNLTGMVNAAGDGLALTGPGGSATGLIYTGLTAYDASGKTLPASLAVQVENGQRELLIHVNDAGAEGQITIDPFVEEAKLTASDGTSSSNFGYSVAVSGDTVVVGVPNANAAYVFTEPASGWANMTQTAKLTASDGTAKSEFGYSVAISGNTVVVTAPDATGSIPGRPGAIYEFTEPTTGWADMTQTAKFTPSDGATGPWFGQSVAISGNTVVVGATGTAASGYSNSGTGAAYVFVEPSGGWANMNQTATLTNSDGAASDNFGCSIAIDGSTMVVGAEEATIGANSGQGAAYIYSEPGGGWVTSTETAKLTASDGAANNLFGASVSVSGNLVAVGAWGANASQGTAYVFTEPGDGWASMTQTAKLTASDGAAGDNFGFSVSISGNIVVVAAPDAKIGANSKQGAAYVFTEAGNAWGQTTKLTASEGTAGNLFGNSISISGGTVVVGADNANGGQGAAYVDQLQTTNVTVQSISPAAGPLAGGTPVTINGTGFSTATVVDFGTVPVTSFTINSAAQITAVSPAGTAGTVDVTVTSPAGTSTTSSTDQFTYAAAPALTAISPAAGPSTGGTSVTITGTNFSGGTLVDFGTIPASKVVVDSAIEITAISPAEAAGTVDVTVTSPGGASATSPADQFTAIAVPTVTAVTPAAGPLAGGTSVTITGTGLTGASVVDFGTLAATMVVVSATQIAAISPAGANGTVDVTVTGPGGVSMTSSADQFAYMAAPAVTTITPTNGPMAGGTLVTITGTNLTGATLVDFGTLAATNVVVDSPTQITATSPEEVAGTVDVTVASPGGVSATSPADQFAYLAVPTVTAVSPAAGPLAGGTSVTITGTGFTVAAGVDFGAIAATNVTVVSPTQITATSPAEAAGTVNITVTTFGGVSASSPADHFAYAAAPVVLIVSPAAGPSSGGTPVTITGTGFTAATAVYFNAFAATNVTVVSPTQITATSPAEAAGTVDVIVAAPGGSSATSPADQFTFVPAPDVTGVSPAAGPLAGGTKVTITGVNFAGATALYFGTTLATNLVVDSPAQITATDPAELAGAVDVTVVTADGFSGTSLADQFTYMAAPTVTGLSPTAGPLAGKTTVTITGAGFTGATVVDFGTTAASHVIINSPTQILATDPAEAAGTVNVTVTGPGGVSTISPADQFTYAPAPTVTAVSPASGPLAGGTTVTITGTGFSGAPVVDFGLKAATNVVVVSPTQITAASPAGAVGTVNVTVTAPGGTSATSATDVFTYVAAPTVTSVAPGQGVAAGGTAVTITGAHFNGATVVDFGTVAAAHLFFDSATQITATSPAELAGTVDVTVTTPGGVSAASSADRFTYLALPTVMSVSPTAGPLAGGTTVTIIGAGFTAATVVDFGTKAAASFKVVSPTQITATSPAEAAGTVDMTVTGPGGVSTISRADQFTYLAAPTVTAVNPTAGPMAGGTTVTITGTGFSGASVVDFGTVAATSAVVVSPTQITATSPAEAAGTVNVMVTGSGGASTISAADQFAYLAAPTVTVVSPTAGPSAGGTTVTITGTGFTAATIVDFGTIAATNVVVVSPTQITVTSPAQAAGTIDITVTSPGGVSTTLPADQFKFLPAPSFTLTGPTAGTFTVGQTVSFQWTAANVDPGSTICLAYDTTSNWGNPTWIEINAVSAAGGAGAYAWNTSAVAPGTYYLEGYMNDAGSEYSSNLGSAITIAAAVATPPVVATNPSSRTTNAGKTVIFTAAATGTPTPTVQWQVSINNGASFTNIPNATSTTYTMTAATSQSGYQYRAVFTNSAGSATTKAATLGVLPAGIPQLPTVPGQVPRMPSIP